MSSNHPAPPPANAFLRWTEQERQSSLESALKDWRAGQDLWIFGYGSLIWRPEFRFTEQRAATLHGYHRALCLWSRINRGTPEIPGLVFGLEQGGSCQGVAFKVASEDIPQTFEAVWKREMSTGAYLPSWLGCTTPQGEVSGMAFVINPQGPAYVPEPPEDDLVEIILKAHGIYGSCLDYVAQTAIALREADIYDPRLAKLAERLALEQRKRQQQQQQA